MAEPATTEVLNGTLSPQMVLLFLVLFLGVVYWGFSGYRRRKDDPGDDDPGHDD